MVVTKSSVGASLTLCCQSGRSYGAFSVIALYFYRQAVPTGLTNICLFRVLAVFRPKRPLPSAFFRIPLTLHPSQTAFCGCVCR
jgi:hypothetical protein